MKCSKGFEYLLVTMFHFLLGEILRQHILSQRERERS